MGVAIIGIGLPGSGKTEALKKIATETRAIYICPNDIAEGLPFPMPITDIWSQAYARIRMALWAGHNVVINATNVRAHYRRILVERVSGWATEIVGLWFDTPYEVCLRNTRVPEAAMRTMATALEIAPPDLNEGFNNLYIVKPSPNSPTQ